MQLLANDRRIIVQHLEHRLSRTTRIVEDPVTRRVVDRGQCWMATKGRKVQGGEHEHRIALFDRNAREQFETDLVSFEPSQQGRVEGKPLVIFG